jgi:hypothetical protein
MANDGDHLLFGNSSSILLMENAHSGKARLWNSTDVQEFVRNYDFDTNPAKMSQHQLLMLKGLKTNGLDFLRYFAIFAGCDYSTMAGIGPVKLFAQCSTNPVPSVAALIDTLLPLSTEDVGNYATVRESITYAYELFHNPIFLDPISGQLLRFRSRVHVLALAGVPANFLNANHLACYNMQQRWDTRDPLFAPVISVFEGAIDRPYFLPQPFRADVIPGAVLDPAKVKAGGYTKEQLLLWCATREIQGISGQTKLIVQGFVQRRMEMERTQGFDAESLISHHLGISRALLMFRAGLVHANDLRPSYLSTPNIPPLEQFRTWGKEIDREAMKAGSAYTEVTVFARYAQHLAESTAQLRPALPGIAMDRAIKEGRARAQDFVTEEQAATLSVASFDLNGRTCRVIRMAVKASMHDATHHAGVIVAVTKVDASAPRRRGLPLFTTEEIVASTCSCKAGLGKRDVHIVILLGIYSDLQNLRLPKTNVCVTSMACQWIRPSAGPCADVTVPLELQMRQAALPGAGPSGSKRSKRTIQNGDLGRGNLTPHVVALTGTSGERLCDKVQKNLEQWRLNIRTTAFRLSGGKPTAFEAFLHTLEQESAAPPSDATHECGSADESDEGGGGGTVAGPPTMDI